MKINVELPSYGIKINFVADKNFSGGEITSDLKFDGPEGKDEELFNSAIDGILATVLGHAIAGINVQSPNYLEGIESAVESLE